MSRQSYIESMGTVLILEILQQPDVRKRSAEIAGEILNILKY